MAGCAVEAGGIELTNEMHVFSNVLESVTLTFVPIFRFYYLSLSHGFRKVLATRKLEMLFYFLVATHEDLMAILALVTGVSWEYAQGVYMRGTISICILLNIRHKLKQTSANTRGTSGGISSAGENGAPRQTFNSVLPMTSPIVSSIRNTVTRGVKNVTSGKSITSVRSSTNITKIGVAGPALPNNR
ncbi:unnamed protein product [Phytophthora fragariaefolia]|uniref:Unnamed protein product n=1 Tax=Phytophthora fragariaefolia TaxID=1490495 RepID=A0A9W6XP38_9STRA|nr:unnamed protein product [Phytophthora fragariaefolia]